MSGRPAASTPVEAAVPTPEMLCNNSIEFDVLGPQYIAAGKCPGRVNASDMLP